MKIGILCSGKLGYQLLNKLISTYNVGLVLTDSNSEKIIKCCKNADIPCFIGNPRSGATQDFLKDKTCDILLSINYLFIIEKDLIDFPSKLAFNVHGSLLPKYRGRTPHVWAIINNEKKTGITAHCIEEGCDTGDIIEQIELEITPQDTGADVLTKFEDNYYPLIQKVLKSAETNELSFKKQENSKATYFGKRTPLDGKINWNWQKERIYNWVRAQAHPYPGAFTFFEGNKLTIDKISFSEDGYDFSIQNGTVLSIDPLKVKSPNGVIKIESHREKINLEHKKQIVLT